MKIRKQLYLIPAIAALLMAGCNDKNRSNAPEIDCDSVFVETVADSSLYGVLGDGTTMNTLQLITDVGDTMELVLASVDSDISVVYGGLLAGDRVAVLSHMTNGEHVADKVINITSLLGKWTSLDKSFEIREGGIVESSIKAETNPWTQWKLLNGNIVLNADTFQIDLIGPDSLCLENDNGIFAYRRQ